MSDYIYVNGELYHYGVKGMKWGVRRAKANVKAAGHRTMGKIYELNERTYSKNNKTLASMNRAAKNESYALADKYKAEAASYKTAQRNAVAKREKPQKELTPEQKAARRKKALKVGAAVVATGLAVYGGYKMHEVAKTNAAKKGAEAAARMLERQRKSEDFLRQQTFDMARDMMRNSNGHGQVNMNGMHLEW